MAREKHVLLLPGYYVRDIHRGIVSYARQAGWSLDASMVHSGKIPKNWHGDGIIAFTGGRPDIVRIIRKSRVPAVDLLDRDTKPHLPCVLGDNAATGRMAGEYLIAQGFRDIGYAYYDPAVANPRNEAERCEGLRQVVEAAGRNFHVIPYSRSTKRFKALPRPIALMAQNDHVGGWLIRQLQRAGLRVPQDAAVIGIESDDLYRLFSPVPQTSVDGNYEYVGYAAAELLDKLMHGAPPPRNPVVIPPIRVIERESTALQACSHRPTAKALAYLRTHWQESPDVGTVARMAGMSRRQLNEQFHRHVGEPINRYLIRLRVTHARNRLADSDEKIQSVASECGFASTPYFCTVFRQETGLTPLDFRQRARINRAPALG